MHCEFWNQCHQNATEKHHITYFPERTIAVCYFHGRDIHRHPNKYPQYLQYRKGEAKEFYSQKERIENFIRRYLVRKRR